MTFIGMLAILFIGLKLAAIIDWSWWLVLIPLYPAILGLVGIIVGSIFVLSDK